MRDTISARLALAIFLVATFIHGLTAQVTATKQEMLDQAAANLDIKIAVWTNHIITNNHKVVFQFANNGKVPILVDDDWKILFSMRDNKSTTQPEYVVHGLRLQKADGCSFEISKKPGFKPHFPGLKPGDKFVMTIDSFTGLSVFKYDIDNNFVITANNLAARVIASTTSEDLNFVFLSSDNKTRTDPSTTDPYRRHLMAAEVPDTGRVGRNIIVPAAKNMSEMTGALIDFNVTANVFLYFSPSIGNTFRTYLQNELLTVTGINQQKLRFVNAPSPSSDVGVYINVIVAADATKTKDGYKFSAVFDQAGRHTITLTANHESGLSNAMETFLSLLGIYSIVPAITIDDDADTGIRSVKLDVTKSFFPVATILKLLRLMKMYKFNELVLVLGSDDAMRVALLDKADFKEIQLFATNQCLGKTTPDCNPNYYKASQAYSASGKGFYTVEDFVRILVSAQTLSIDVVPYVNLIGCLRSAKKASHLRFERLRNTNPTEAERLHLMSAEPSIPQADLPAGSCYSDCMLDPCNPATLNFAQEVFDTFKDLYSMAGVQLNKFSVGGDGFTKYFSQFSSCVQKGFSQADAMRYLLEQLGAKATAIGATLRVSEDAVIDPSTGTCLTGSATYAPANLQVEFSKLAPGDMSEWNLTAAQQEFLLSEVIPYNESDPNSVQDPLRIFNGPKKGLAPWGRAYSCANNGYKVILNPNNYFHLDNAYELDFGELGTFKKDGFFVVNNFRLQTYEPLNMHINMDVSSTGGTFLPYRFAQIFQTEPLNNPASVIGLEASADTRVIGNEDQLWYALLPRLLVISQKMWRRSEFENLVYVENSSTLVDYTLSERRTGIMRFELLDLLHNLGYKEFGRLEAKGYTYRIPKVEAHIRFGIAQGQPSPWPLMAKADVPGTEIEIREINGTIVGAWRPMFDIDPITGAVTGGYLFNFPPSPSEEQKVELRTQASESNRYSQSYVITGSSENLFPRDIPPELRSGACLPIREPWRTDINTLTEAQWKRIISNMYTVSQEETQFRMDRQRNLTTTLLQYNRQFRRNYNVQDVLFALGEMARRDENATDLPSSDARRVIFDTDMALQADREAKVIERFDRWEEVYERCQRGQSQVLPPVQIPLASAGGAGAFPGAPGMGPGGAPGMGPGGAPGIGPGGAQVMGPGVVPGRQQAPVVPGGGVRPAQG